jgi:hypothetical protein
MRRAAARRIARCRRAVVAAVVLAAAAPAHADDDFGDGHVIFARGAALYQVDARGRNEAQLAPLPAKVTVRALRSDAEGKVLLADLAGKWAWMPLDGQAKALLELPCGDGPAQLAEDGTSVLCRSPKAANQAIVIELGGKAAPVALPVPPAGARLVGTGIERKLVWADSLGVWRSPDRAVTPKDRLAPDAPLRGFLASPDGARAIAVYADTVFADVHHTRSAEVLMTVQLDGKGARRKAIRDGVAVEWSHDAQWILVQDGASACIMRASGGQYKCWKGFTAASLSPDGRWGLVLGNRDGSRKQTPVKPSKSAKARPAPPPAQQDEPTDEPESADAPPASDDVSVAPPTGPLALYRTRLEGAFTDRPTLLVKVVDGAAVWVP